MTQMDRVREQVRAGRELVVVAADGSETQCYGLGYLGPVPVTFVCTGHRPGSPCKEAFVSSASEGDQFIACSGEGFKVVAGKIKLADVQEERVHHYPSENSGLIVAIKSDR